jgi:hypothetical protein
MTEHVSTVRSGVPRKLTPDKDERISDEGRPRELGEIADHGERHKDDQLGKDEIARGDVCPAVGHRQHERLHVLGDEDGVRWDVSSSTRRRRNQRVHSPATKPIWEKAMDARMVSRM